jgi:hypothetical protein
LKVIRGVDLQGEFKMYPTVNGDGLVVMVGVPSSLVDSGTSPVLYNGVPLMLYFAVSNLESTASEHNCDCLNDYPALMDVGGGGDVWGKTNAALGDYDVDYYSGISFVTRGLRWANSGGELYMGANAASSDVKAVSSELADMNTKAFETVEFDWDVYDRKCENNIAECYVVELTSDVVNLIPGVVFSRSMGFDCEYKEGLPQVRWDAMKSGQLYGFRSGTSIWLPSGGKQFCIVGGEVGRSMETRYSVISSSFASEVFFDGGAYFGTCLNPNLFKRGSIFPPWLVTSDNASVHYCNGEYGSNSIVDFEMHGGEKYVFCSGDRHGVVERQKICSAATSTLVQVGKVFSKRSTVTEACGEAMCLLIAGDKYSSITDVMNENYDITGYTMIFLNVDIGILEKILFDVYEYDVIVEKLGSTDGRGVPGTGAKAIGDMYGVIESYYNSTHYVFGTAVYTSVYSEMSSGVAISANSVTVESAFAERPVTFSSSSCVKFSVSGDDFSVSNVIFNQSLCSEESPVVIGGKGGQILNTTVIDGPSAVLYGGGYERTNVSGSVVSSTVYVYNPSYVGERYVGGIYGNVAGDAIMSEGDVGGYDLVSLGVHVVCDSNAYFSICENVDNKEGDLVDIGVCSVGCPKENRTSSLGSVIECLGPTNAAKLEKACSEYSVYEVNNNTYDGIGMSCGVIFPELEIANSCGNREKTEVCSMVNDCSSYYDSDFSYCIEVDKACVKHGTSNSCSGVSGSLGQTNDDEQYVGSNVDRLSQGWLYDGSTVYTSVEAFNNKFCRGGCSNANSCSSNACERIKSSGFVCFQDDLSTGSCLTRGVFSVDVSSGGDLFTSTLCGSKGCLYNESVYLFTAVREQKIYSLSFADDPYNCMGFDGSISACSPCLVGPGSGVRPKGSCGDVEMGVCGGNLTIIVGVGVCVSREAVICDFAGTGMKNEYPMGGGIGLVGLGGLLGEVKGAICGDLADNVYSSMRMDFECLNGVCVKSGGERVSMEYGEMIEIGSEQCVVSVFHGILQSPGDFSLTSIGGEVVDVGALLECFGVPYEHSIFHGAATYSATIGIGFGVLVVGTMLGVIACLAGYFK